MYSVILLISHTLIVHILLFIYVKTLIIYDLCLNKKKNYFPKE